LVKVDLPYLWAATGRRGRQYWFYRRDRKLTPITSPEGRRLRPGDAGFLEAYERIHDTFGVDTSAEVAIGTVAHLIEVYRAAPEFRTKTAKTKKDYGRYLDMLKEKHGHRSVATMPRGNIQNTR
jgi:hypothetical protein